MCSFTEFKGRHDRFWSALVLFSAFVCQLITLGITQNFGIYVKRIRDDYKVETWETTLIGSIAYGCFCLIGPISGLLYRRFGCQTVVISGGLIASLGILISGFTQTVWQLYLSYGVLGGIGLGFVYMASISVLPDYFDKWKFFATAFVTVGSSVGNLTLSHLFLPLINQFGWKKSLMITSSLTCFTCILGIFLSNKKRPDRNIPLKSLLETSLFSDVKFYLFCLSCVLWSGSIYVVFQLVNVYATANNISDDKVSLLLTIQGGANLIGRLLSAIVGQWSKLDRICLYTLGLFVLTAGFFGFAFSTAFVPLAVCMMFIGFGYGVMLAQVAGVLINCFGAPKLANSIGYALFAMGIGGLAFPPIGGMLVNRFAPMAAFLFAAVATCVATMLSSMLLWVQRKENLKNQKFAESPAVTVKF